MKQSSISSSEEEHYKKKFGSIIFEEPNYGKKLIEMEKKKSKQENVNETGLSPSEQFKLLHR